VGNIAISIMDLHTPFIKLGSQCRITY